MNKRFFRLVSFFFLCLLFLPVPFLEAQSSPVFPETGDPAIARRYLEWAEKEFQAGRIEEALAALERGADYGGVSSDLSFFLARLRSAADRPRGAVLEACRLALETDRWERYVPGDARILAAETLCGLRLFEEALGLLQNADPEAYETRYWRLFALRGLEAEGEFRRNLALVLDRFPRSPGPVRLLFAYGKQRPADDGIRPLMDLALRRLPVLIAGDPALAYLAAPFLRDTEEARRYVASYRAGGKADPASLPAALNLGLVDGKQAVEELFSPVKSSPGLFNRQNVPGMHTYGFGDDIPVLDRDLITEVWALLRTGDERDFLKQRLLNFSGAITEDRDFDGIIEGQTVYQNGMILLFMYDADQDGLSDLTVSFIQGVPFSAEISLSGEGGRVFPLKGEDQKPARLVWEQYPAVLHTDLEGRRYMPRPMDYFYTPLRFITLVEGGPDYPEREEPLPPLNERSLLSFSAILRRPSEEFSNATEELELNNGIPVKSTLYYENGKKAAETEYSIGRPLLQRLDLDQDGRMETIRRFERTEPPFRVLSSESDWDGDGIFEYAETLQQDGTIKKSWDLDRDGIRETER